MTHIHEQMVARKYARAFLKVFSAQIKKDDFARLESISAILERKKGLVLFLRLGIIPPAIKAETVIQLLHENHLFFPWDILIHALLKHKRIVILTLVFAYIKRFYFEMIDTLIWHVSSSVPLDLESQKTIEEFLIAKTNKKSECSYHIDKKLIAGVRMQTDTLLWEYSIAKKLRKAHVFLIEQEVL